MPPKKRVVLLISTSSTYGREAIEGVNRFAQSLGTWQLLHLFPDRFAVDSFRLWKPDGVIGMAKPEIRSMVRKTKLRFINISGTSADIPCPQVCTNSLAIGRMAAAALVDRGFRRLAYFGTTEPLSRTRLEGFEGYADEHGLTCDVKLDEPHKSKRDWNWEAIQQGLSEWVKKLPKPVGVMAFNDDRGGRILQACDRSGLRVPEEVAVIGVDNDEIFCSMTSPPLASVRLPTRQIGFAAAQILHEWMDGAKPKMLTELDPIAVATRHSCDTVAIEDQTVAAAMNFIRGHANTVITVSDILDAVSVSRRTLERLFTKVLRSSPRVEIRRAQLERAKAMLRDTDIKIPVVAERSGFMDSKLFAVVFKKLVGMSPSKYRKRHRLV